MSDYKSAKKITRAKKIGKSSTVVMNLGDRYEQIFGKVEPAQSGKFVFRGGKVVNAQDVAAKPVSDSPAIHDDRLYAGVWDFGAGRVFNSRSERARWMKERGVECVG